MTDQKYIVLRKQQSIAPEAGAMGGFGGNIAGAESVEVEELTLSSAERADLRRDPRTQAMARPMPMKLIEPTERADAAPAAGPTWGVEAVRATQSPFDGNEIVVCVLDTGIDPNHPAFAGMDIVQKNFTTEGDDDIHGHGTHVAGTIFGQDVAGERIGVARNIRRALIGKVLGQGGNSSAVIAQAIQWALGEGAHIISMSLGIDFPGFVDFLVNDEGLDINPATSIALEQYRANVNLFSAIADMVHAQGQFGQGSILVAASGNESNRPQFEIAVAPPAAGTGVIAVGALQEGANGFSIAGFSNNQVDVAAPGVGVRSARVGGGLATMSGTSMATPHVAGVAALWAQKLRDATGRVEADPLIAKLVASGVTESLAAGFEEDDTGTGLVQAPLS